ncbi:hypothetical protein [Methylohalobius crimeensis]|uniref:hypothetical protein n=1 Tax=Methylohalobius crimeensis TaxID=244365 RepID=UPI0003B592FD|nr:hypothetical protein [Methylohalobius crimeensis]
MGNWLSILRGLLGLAEQLTEWLNRRQLLEAGESRAVARGLKDAQETIRRAQAARRGVRHDADSVRRDPDNRD